MKKLLLIFSLAFAVCTQTFAQQDVTKFLGIPVDGTKQEMIQKLKAKGFTYNSTYDWLEGEFNGRNVIVCVVTNNNKVYRITVRDATMSNETDIKIRFNNLCQQFSNNSKYISATLGSYEISEDEDISYEMSVHSKRYEADYYQMSDQTDTAIVKKTADFLLSKYTAEQIANPTEEIRTEMLSYLMAEWSKKTVWFMIYEWKYGDYCIAMYYDNKYNQSNGEDL